MIASFRRYGIPQPVPRQFVPGGGLFRLSTLLQTSDGDVLYSTDDAFMTLGGPTPQSATRPPVLLYTTDHATLFTTDNDTLTV